MWSRWYLLLPLVILVPIAVLFAMSLFAGRPTNLGVKAGKLASCPDSPNSVSTQAEDSGHHIEAIRFTGPATEAMTKLKQALAALPRARIVTESADYLHVECTSLLFRFVDDVEFWIDEANATIHFRSASRVGRSDFGVNRARMEAIRQEFAKL